MADAEARRRFLAAPVARLATAGDGGNPHLVPVVFAVGADAAGDIVYTAVDGKPKSTQQLRRLTNIARNNQVSLLVDHYEDDWTMLWWARADGIASVHTRGAAADNGRDLLRAKYPQYQTISIEGPVIAIHVTKWTGWGIGQRVPPTPDLQ